MPFKKLTADQFRELHDADPEGAFGRMADLANGILEKAHEKSKASADEVTNLRARRVSRAIVDQVTDTGKVPEEHQEDRSVKKILAIQAQLAEAKQLADSRGDYDEIKTQLEDLTTSSGALQAQLDEATTDLGRYRSKEDQAWRRSFILETAKEHKIPLRPGLVRYAEEALRPFVTKNGNGGAALTKDGKPLVGDGGKEISARDLVEDLRHGKIVGIDNANPDLFDTVDTGPSTLQGTDQMNQLPGATDESLQAALEGTDLAAIHKAAYGERTG